jgi:TIR domain
MAYVSEAEVRRRGRRISEGHVKVAKSLSAETDVFLSYARIDEELIAGAVGLLIDLGATPYVDQSDFVLEALFTGKSKAKLLRERIKQCGRLVLLLTENSVISNWTPWEVGIADGMHGINKVATFPLRQPAGSDDWGLREYLANYPQIQEVTLQGDDVPTKAVSVPGTDKYWRFKTWLSRRGS